MARPMILMRCPLEGQQIPSIEGYQRALCQVPLGAEIVHLGSDPPSNEICMFVMTGIRDPDPENEGKPMPYKPEELQTFEFVVLTPGMPLAAEDYVMRAPVRTEAGLIFLFEKRPKGNGRVAGGGRILVPRGLN